MNIKYGKFAVWVFAIQVAFLHVFGFSSPSQIFQSYIGFFVVQVASYQAFRSRADKRLQHQKVDAAKLLLTVFLKAHHRIALLVVALSNQFRAICQFPFPRRKYSTTGSDSAPVRDYAASIRNLIAFATRDVFPNFNNCRFHAYRIT